MSCQLSLIARVSDLNVARRYLFPCQKETSVEGIKYEEIYYGGKWRSNKQAKTVKWR